MQLNIEFDKKTSLPYTKNFGGKKVWRIKTVEVWQNKTLVN